MNRLSIPVLVILAIFSASQSSLFSGSADLGAAIVSSSCAAEPTMETITLTGDFGIFTRSMCPDTPLR